MLSCPLTVAATFNADPLARPLAFWGALGAEARVAPYATAYHHLLAPDSLLRRNAEGASALLVRLADAPGAERDAKRDAEAAAAELAEAVHRSGVSPLIVVACPEPAEVSAPEALQWAHRLADLLAGAPGVEVVSADALTARYPVTDRLSAHGDALGHVPYTAPFYTALTTGLVRHVAARQRPPVKVIAVDADGTLWRGVCGEAPPDRLGFDAPFVALQRFLLQQRAAGRLLCLVSKNEPVDVEAVFAARPEMPLRMEHFAATRISWEPKSAGLRRLAAELGLGLDAFLFLDDSAVEVAEVRAHAPEVVTLHLPEPEAFETFLDHVWPLDVAYVTPEDTARAERYRAEAQRRRARAASDDFRAFLDGLDLAIDIRPLAEPDLDRAAQLTLRTNQFNTTTLRRTTADLSARLADPVCLDLVVSVRDRFGDYGTVGLALARLNGKTATVEALMLSCRALGRGVEHAMVRALAERAAERGGDRLALAFRPTERNTPARRFLEHLPEVQRTPDRFLLAFEHAVALRFEPDATESDATESVAPQPARAADSALVQRVATEWARVEAIERAMRSPTPETVGEPVGEPPRTATERVVAQVFAGALGRPVGRDGHFFDLGGDSLEATFVLAQIHKRFGVALALDALYTHPTVAALALHVQRTLVARAAPERLAAALRAMDGERAPAVLRSAFLGPSDA